MDESIKHINVFLNVIIKSNHTLSVFRSKRKSILYLLLDNNYPVKALDT